MIFKRLDGSFICISLVCACRCGLEDAFVAANLVTQEFAAFIVHHVECGWKPCLCERIMDCCVLLGVP